MNTRALIDAINDAAERSQHPGGISRSRLTTRSGPRGFPRATGHTGPVEVLADSPWDFTLYREGGDVLVLSVVCGTVGVFELDFELGPTERARWEAEGIDALLPLAEAIRDDPHAWAPRCRPPAGREP